MNRHVLTGFLEGRLKESSQSTAIDTTLAFNVRPLLTAYFVDADDVERFRDIALFSCTQWGGIHNYIIPVAEDGVDGWYRCVSRHQPDRVVMATRRFTDRARVFQDEHFSHREVDWDWEAHKLRDDAVHAASLYPVVSGYPTLVPSTTDAVRTLLLYQIEPDASLFEQAAVAAIFGNIYPEQREYYESRFRLATINGLLPGLPWLDHQLSLDHLASPINLTQTRILKPMGMIEGRVYFDVILAENVADLCWYWTIRAVRNSSDPASTRRTLLVPSDKFVDTSFRRHLVEVMRSQLATHPHLQCPTDIVFHVTPGGGTRCRSAISRSVKAHLFRKRRDDESIGTTWKSSITDLQAPVRHTSQAPLVYNVNINASTSAIRRVFGVDNPPLRLQELREGRNLVQGPTRNEMTDMAGRIALDIVSEVWSRYPPSHEVAQLVQGGSRFTDFGLTVTLYRARYDQPIELYLPPGIEAIRVYLAEHGHEAGLNSVGLQAQALVRLLGGLAQCEIFRDRAVHGVLNALAVRSPGRIGQSVAGLLHGRIRALDNVTEETIADIVAKALRDAEVLSVASKVTPTFRDLANADELRPHRQRLLDVLDDLVSKRIVFRGAYLVCVACGVRTWFPLGSFQDHLTCPGCFTDQHLSVKSGGDERRLEFRLNTVVNAAIDSDVLVPILLLAHLQTRPAPHRLHSPLVGLEFKRLGAGNADGDFDIVYVRNQRLYAGECKSGAALREKDINLGRRARELGFTGFHFASLQGFSSEALGMIEIFKREVAGSGNFDVFIHGPLDLLT